jgi:hypothetical protein
MVEDLKKILVKDRKLGGLVGLSVGLDVIAGIFLYHTFISMRDSAAFNSFYDIIDKLPIHNLPLY